MRSADPTEYIYRVTRPGGRARVGTKARITSILSNTRRGSVRKVERAEIGEWKPVTGDFAHLGYDFGDEDE